MYRRLCGPQGWLGQAENLVPTGIRSRTVQPIVVSRYTDGATRATPYLLYSFKYLEDLTLWHEWVLVLTATTATGQPLLSNNTSGSHCPTFRIPIRPYIFIALYLAYKTLRLCHYLFRLFYYKFRLRVSYLTLGVFLTCSSVKCVLRHFVCTVISYRSVLNFLLTDEHFPSQIMKSRYSPHG